jgi:hypothetical protein
MFRVLPGRECLIEDANPIPAGYHSKRIDGGKIMLIPTAAQLLPVYVLKFH